MEQAAYSQHERNRWLLSDRERQAKESGPYVPLTTLEARIYGNVTFIDTRLYYSEYYGGAYCSPDIGPLVWRSEDTMYAVLLVVTAFLAIVVFRKKKEEKAKP